MDFNAIRKSKEESVNCENRAHFFCNSSYRIQVNFTQSRPRKINTNSYPTKQYALFEHKQATYHNISPPCS